MKKGKALWDRSVNSVTVSPGIKSGHVLPGHEVEKQESQRDRDLQQVDKSTFISISSDQELTIRLTKFV